MKKRRYAIYGVITILVGWNILFWSLAGMSKVYAGRVPYGIVVHGQSLSGLSREIAIEKLRPMKEEMEKKTITLLIEENPSIATAVDLGYSVEIEKMVDEAIARGEAKHPFSLFVPILYPNRASTVSLEISLDQIKQDAFFSKLKEEFTTEPKDISLEFKEGKIIIVPSEEGQAIDEAAARTLLHREIATTLNNQEPKLALPVITSAPAIKDETQVAAAKQSLEKIVTKPLVVQVEESKVTINPDTIFSFVVFASENNQLVITYDQPKIKQHVDEIARKVSIKPVTKKLSTVDSSIINEGRDGRKINTDDATNQILQRLKTASFDTPVVLAAEKIDRQTVTEAPEYQLGRTEGKYIELDLSLQRMNIIEGNNHIAGYSVSTGKWSTPTPIGEFTIKNHIRTAWSNRYKLYMPFWMAIQKPSGEYDGYGIHGLPYWPNGAVEGSSHIGRPASHGCIRLGAGSIDFLYEWAVDGTKVFIHE